MAKLLLMPCCHTCITARQPRRGGAHGCDAATALRRPRRRGPHRLGPPAAGRILGGTGGGGPCRPPAVRRRRIVWRRLQRLLRAKKPGKRATYGQLTTRLT